MDKELRVLINKYLPKRYYGHELRRYAGVIAIQYSQQQQQNISVDFFRRLVDEGLITDYEKMVEFRNAYLKERA